VSFSTDWRFTTARSREIVRAMVRAGADVSFAEINTEFGHDSFLMPVPDYMQVFNAYMTGIET
jgi:homoserine O-acetyltransferase